MIAYLDTSGIVPLLVDEGGTLICQAADLAKAQALRAYDAVHLAAALQVVEADLVLVAGDRALLTTAESLGPMVAAIA